VNVQRHDVIDVKRWKGRAFFGGWRETTFGAANVVDPSSGQIIASIGLNGPADVTRAASDEKEAQPAWAAKLPSERAAILNRAAELLEQNAEELIDWIVAKRARSERKRRFEIEHGVGFIRHAAASGIERSQACEPSPRRYSAPLPAS
jgi:benzaldehyde dehydrogenase (NAD)